jgi:glycosyltransferase involved in cell wall biosynthesis
MRILHINKFLYRRGGAEGYMLDLAEHQESSGHDVAFFAMRHPENLSSRFEAAFPSEVSFDPPPPTVAGKALGAGRMLWSRSAARGMDAVIRRFRPDIAHLHNVYHQLSPSVLAPLRRHGVPAVMTLHDYKLACTTYRFLDHGEICEACLPRRLWQPILRRCNDGSLAASTMNAVELTVHTLARAYDPVSLFLCPSRFLLDKMRSAHVFPERLRHLPNFTDVRSIEPKEHPGGNVVYAGRLSHEKGIDVLIEAVVMHRLHLDIAGDGPARAALERQAARSDTSDQIRFHGRLESAALRELLRRSAVAAVCSRYHENMPLAVLEAFAAGLPVVVSALGGLPELIDPDVDGIVVPPNDAAALGSNLARLVRTPELAFAMGSKGRAKAERRYTADGHMARLTDLYSEAAARRSHRSRMTEA